MGWGTGVSALTGVVEGIHSFKTNSAHRSGQPRQAYCIVRSLMPDQGSLTDTLSRGFTSAVRQQSEI